MTPKMWPEKARRSREARVENCPVCGRLMNRERLADGRSLQRCKGEKEPRPHTTLVWVK